MVDTKTKKQSNLPDCM